MIPKTFAMTYATPRTRTIAVLLAMSLGISLAFGLLGTLDSLLAYFGLESWKGLAFPVFSFLLWQSLRSPSQTPTHVPRLWLGVPVPLVISFIYGQIQDSPGLFSETLSNLAWPMLWGPLGEEFLFRGWVYNISERLFPKTFFTFANPFPVSIWVSAIAFSLWHIQNVHNAANGWVLLQLGYTLIIGIWLGHWRWKTRSLKGPLLIHVLLNVVSLL